MTKESTQTSESPQVEYLDYEFFHPTNEIPGDTQQELVKRYVYHTKRLIDKITGYGDPDEQFDAVIFLDKSARNFGYLARAFWEDLAYRDFPYEGATADEDSPRLDLPPPFLFLNIDKNQWVKPSNIIEDPNIRGLERWNREDEASELAILGLRRMFLAEHSELAVKNQLSQEDLKEIKELPTVFTSMKNHRPARLLIVDEVESTGTTLRLAKKMIGEALPEVELGQTYAMRGNHKILPTGGAAMFELPLWYNPLDAKNKYGEQEDFRAEKGIGPRDADFHAEKFSEDPEYYWREYAGRQFMSTPLTEEKHLRRHDQVRRDIQQMVSDYRRGAIEIPKFWNPYERFK